MKWISVDNEDVKLETKDVVLNNMSNINSLFLPDNIDCISNINNILEKYDDYNIIYHILNIFFDDIKENTLKNIIKNTINFDCPLKKINDEDYILELYHGPTKSFKDYGARIMSQITQYYSKLDNNNNNNNNNNKRVLVATSGDTGSAVADAFNNTNIPVTIFYPGKSVSQYQKKQLTTYENITSIEIKGSFDDCQKIVKTLLNDQYIKKNYTFLSANSINVSRLIPQIIYYFLCFSKLIKENIDINKKNIIFTIPSGNLGNATACIIAKKLGLPIHKIIIACNDNNTFINYLRTLKYEPQNTISTISNAMDVGNPSNIRRIIYFLNKYKINNLNNDIIGYSITEDQTKNTIKLVYDKYNYLIDPHTAVGYKATMLYKENITSNNNLYITLSTASPIKYKNIITNVLCQNITFGDDDSIILGKKSYNFFMKNNDISIFKKLYETRNIIFIGMPASGKSTIGSNINNWNIIETDDMIIKKENMSLSDIINNKGKKYFHNIEEEIIINLNINNNNNNKTIISTGGSVVYSDKSMNFLKEKGVIIYLKVSFNEIHNRITLNSNISNRGILFNDNKTFEQLYNERIVLYDKYCDLYIDNDNYTINEITNIIDNML